MKEESESKFVCTYSEKFHAVLHGVGNLLLLARLSNAVDRVVDEHHERLDGQTVDHDGRDALEQLLHVVVLRVLRDRVPQLLQDFLLRNTMLDTSFKHCIQKVARNIAIQRHTKIGAGPLLSFVLFRGWVCEHRQETAAANFTDIIRVNTMVTDQCLMHHSRSRTHHTSFSFPAATIW